MSPSRACTFAVLIFSRGLKNVQRLSRIVLRRACSTGSACRSRKVASIALKASRNFSFHAAAFFPVKPIARKEKPSRVRR